MNLILVLIIIKKYDVIMGIIRISNKDVTIDTFPVSSLHYIWYKAYHIIYGDFK